MKVSQEPVLQYAILCDAIAKDPSGKPVYIGAFDRLIKPCVLPQFIIALKWICGVGSHKFTFQILNPELGILHKFDEFPMEFKEKTEFVRFDFPIINFNFSDSGVYWIEFLLNNKTYLSIPLPVYPDIS